MEHQEPQPPSGGWFTPMIIIVLVLFAIIYLAFTGEKRIPFNCHPETPGVIPP